MPRTSAGILPYRIEAGHLVFSLFILVDRLGKEGPRFLVNRKG